jgi:hypothetical protein
MNRRTSRRTAVKCRDGSSSSLPITASGSAPRAERRRWRSSAGSYKEADVPRF